MYDRLNRIVNENLSLYENAEEIDRLGRQFYSDLANGLDSFLENFGQTPESINDPNSISKSYDAYNILFIALLRICFTNTKSRRMCEKCAYIILLQYGLVLFSPYSHLFRLWIIKVFERYPDSYIIKFLYSEYVLITQQDQQHYFRYHCMKNLPLLISRALISNIHIVQNNLSRPRLLQFIYPIITQTTGINIEFARFARTWISMQLSIISFLLLYYLKLTQHDITQDSQLINLRMIRDILNYAQNLDAQNPLAVLLIGFSFLNDDSVLAERMILRSLEGFGSYVYSSFLRTKVEERTIAYLGLATIFDKRLIYPLAQDYYNRALTESNSNFLRSIIFLNRGKSHLDYGDLSRALPDLLKAKEDFHTSASAYTNLGLVYYKQGMYGQAENVLNKALDLDPLLPHAYYN